MMYLMAAVFVGWTIGVVAIVIDWRKDCKEIGRENLAVSLGERLRAFFLCFVFPVILGLLTRRKG